MELFKIYFSELNRKYSSGIATEHTYRPALQKLLENILSDRMVLNEPSRMSGIAPDFIIVRKSDKAPMAFVETKDINDYDLDGRKSNKQQFDRYKQTLDRIAFTNYIEFHFYEYGELVKTIRFGEIREEKICPIDDAIEEFVSFMRTFADSKQQKITSANRLASIMGAKARLLASMVNRILTDGDTSYGNKEIKDLYEAFKRILIKDLTQESFADIYAQTITYGMFAARLNDKTPEDFSRQEAVTLIPKSNPFLRKIFQTIAGYDLDERIAWIIDDLAATFEATDMSRIMKGYKTNRRNDPMIHFYEDFLTAYDSKLRKDRGVWYTPAPVVGFIVRSVDEILQKEFNLPEGLADYSMIEREIENENHVEHKRKSKKMRMQKFHKVQILDPAVGTGTFIAEIINRIYDKFSGMEGMWPGYVIEHLLPRLNGFELMMAPYAIAHLKLDWLLNETGFINNDYGRLKVFLTDSLEEHNPETGSVFSTLLSEEADAASHIKRDSPVMVIIGNPPYNVKSTNNGTWIMEQMKSYKMEPGGLEPLKERNKSNLNDDYAKFIRMAQFFIEKNGEGIIAFINPHGFLDNTTYRGMRWELLRTFDLIYTLDLHGNSKKGEKASDGGKDDNVFAIQQGVSINFFIKTRKKQLGELGKVYHADLYGSRRSKYEYLPVG